MRAHKYTFRPKPKFQGESTYYVGVELEVEAPDRQKKLDGLKTAIRPRYYYAKEDGSLCNGWEIVTHPISPNYWLCRCDQDRSVLRFFELVEALKVLGYTSHDNGRCGLHVHVSKTAFGDLYGDHLKRFARLINGVLFCRLSQREESSLERWARQIPDWKYGSSGFYDRYIAVNAKPEHTIEVRIFRGNLRKERILKAIQAVIAAVEFTSELTEDPANIDKSFCEWVSNHKHLYRELNNYIGEMTCA